MAPLSKHTFVLPDNSRFDCWVLVFRNEVGKTEYWFKASDITKFLQYQNPHQAVLFHVRQEWRRSWSSLMTHHVREACTLPPNWQSHSVFVHECGLYSLINKSKKPEALAFQKWLYCDLLPALRRAGTVDERMDKRMDDIQEQMREAQAEIRQLRQEAAAVKGRVAVMPETGDLKHVVSVLKLDREPKDEVEYCVVRCQKKHIQAALRRAAKDYVQVLYREPVPNGMNVLNRAKEILRKRRVPYRAWGVNKIRTSRSADFETMVIRLLES